MVCQFCNRELFPDAKFCHLCGRAVEPQCPTCGTVNPPGSHYCYSCGRHLESEPAATAVGEPPVDTTVAPTAPVCPRCHERNEPGSSYCYACGLPLDGRVSPAVAPGRPIAAFALGRPGGFWVRALAYVIDAVILTVVFAVAWSAFTGEPIARFWEPDEGLTVADLYRFLVDLLYYTIAIAVWATTLGKRPLRLYVVRTDGSRVGVGRAAARYFAYILSILTLGIGFIMIGLRQDKRGLHDLICDTVVIRR